MRSLCLLLGGLGRFVPCSIGANHCSLRHFGWEKCGHGLTSRPRKSASEPFLNELLNLFRYPLASGRSSLLAGAVLLRYCLQDTSWQLPVPGRVVDLVAADDGAGEEDGERFLLVVFARRFAGLVVLVRDGKEFDLTEKPLHTLRVLLFNLGHVFGRDRIQWRPLVLLFLIERGGGAIRMIRRMFLLRSGLGWVGSLGLCMPTSPGLHVLQLAGCSGACMRCCDHTLTLNRDHNNNNHHHQARTRLCRFLFLRDRDRSSAGGVARRRRARRLRSWWRHEQQSIRMALVAAAASQCAAARCSKEPEDRHQGRRG